MKKAEQERIFLDRDGFWVDFNGKPLTQEEIDTYEYGQYLPDGSFEDRHDIKHRLPNQTNDD